MQQSERCAVLLWEERHGCSPVLIAASERAAVMATLIMTARLNDIDPKAWLADVFARIADMPQNRLHELLPLNWTPPASRSSAQAA